MLAISKILIVFIFLALISVVLFICLKIYNTCSYSVPSNELNIQKNNLSNQVNFSNTKLLNNIGEKILISKINSSNEVTYDNVKFLNHIADRILILFKSLNLQNLVIWGHPLHSHTHSYIHEAFFLTGKYLRIPTFWVPQVCYYKNEKVDLGYFPIENSLFITEGQVVDDIPESNTSFYIFHNVTDRVGLKINSTQILNLQVFNKDAIQHGFPVFDMYHRLEIDDRAIYMPWATNLLPHEFFQPVDLQNKENFVNIVGQDGYEDTIHTFVNSCGIPLNRKSGLSYSDAIDHVRNGKCAPSIITKQQKQMKYIPCRTFKNISYGQISVTNSLESYYILHHQAIFDENENILGANFLKTREAFQNNFILCQNLVKAKHTYLNRLEFILQCLQSCKIHILPHQQLNLCCKGETEVFFKFIANKLLISFNNEEDLNCINIIQDGDYLKLHKNNQYILKISQSKSNIINNLEENHVSDKCKFSDLVLRPIFEVDTVSLIDEARIFFGEFDTFDYVNLKYLPNHILGISKIIYLPQKKWNLWIFPQMLQGTIYYVPSFEFYESMNVGFKYSDCYDPYLKHLFFYFDSWEHLKILLENNILPKQKSNITWLKKEMENNIQSWHMLFNFVIEN